MREPDQRDLGRGVGIADDPQQAECNREDLGVREVIDNCPNFGPEGVTGEREVRGQDQGHEKGPAEILVEVEDDRGGPDRETLQPEQQVWEPVHHGATVTP